MGDLYGLFAVTESGEKMLRDLIASGDEVDFGEVLGKHSEVSGSVEAGEVVEVAATDAEIVMVCRVLGRPLTADDSWVTLSGYNPLDYMREEEEDGDDED